MSDTTPRGVLLSRRRRVALAVVAAAALALFLARRPLLEAVPRALVHEDAEAPADAIVVLAGDGGERVQRAVELWKKGLSRSGLVFVSGGALYHTTTWADLMAAHAEELGVPKQKLVKQAVSRTTGEDAVETLAMVEQRGLKSIVLVTSAWHSARARRRFVEAAAGRVDVRSLPCAAAMYPEGWWNDPVAARAVVTEVLKWAWPGKP